MEAPLGWTILHDNRPSLLGAAFGPSGFCLEKAERSRETHGPTRTPPLPDHRPRPSPLLPRMVPEQPPRPHVASGVPPPLREGDADLPRSLPGRHPPSANPSVKKRRPHHKPSAPLSS